MNQRKREETRVSLRQMLLSLIVTLKRLNEEERQVMLGLFELSLKNALSRTGPDKGPLAGTFFVSLRDLESICVGWSVDSLPDIMEYFHRSSPLLGTEEGMLVSSWGSGLALFDIVRTIENRKGRDRLIWWVRPGQWAHWHLDKFERVFVCRVMSAWGGAADGGISDVICHLSLALASLKDNEIDGANVQMKLVDLLAMGTTRRGEIVGGETPVSPESMQTRRRALELLARKGVIDGYQESPELVVTLHPICEGKTSDWPQRMVPGPLLS